MKRIYIVKRLVLMFSVFVLLLAASATVAEAASFDRKVVEQVNEIAENQIELEDTAKEKLKKLFTYVEQEYTVYDMQEFIPYENWEKEYACGIYTEKEGNCYHFAAAYAFLIKKVTNYEVCIGLGKTNGLMTEELTNHAWVEVKIDGQWYICDPFLDKMAADCSGKYFLLSKKENRGIYNEFTDAEYLSVVRKEQWIDEDGIKYYLKSNWEFAIGSYKIDGSYYIFDTQGILLQPEKSSQVVVGETKYYVSTKGKALPGSHKIDGSYYIFDTKGMLLQPKKDSQAVIGKTKYYVSTTGKALPGSHKVDGTYYVFDSKGILLQPEEKSLVKIEKKTYYVSTKGKALSGSYEMDDVYYIFDITGMLLQPKKDSLAKVGDKTYYVSTKGTAVPGWHIVSGKLYNAKQTGAVRKNTEYDGITFNGTGAAKNNEACKLKMTVMKVVDSITRDTMTKQQKLLACWNYMVSRSRFRYVSKYPNLNAKGWTSKTAYNMLSTKSGNCYSFACAFAALAKEVGYKPYVVCGRVSGRRDRARDGLTRHSWVRIDGRYYDPEAQFAGWRRGIYNSKGFPVRHTIQKVVLY